MHSGCNCLGLVEEFYEFVLNQGLSKKLPNREKKVPVYVNLKKGREAVSWLVDNEVTPFLAKYPSFYWKKIITNQSPSLKKAAFMSKWPSFLPQRFKKFIIQNSSEFDIGRKGWLIDVMNDEDEESFAILRKGIIPDIPKYITLNDWVKNIKALDAWDPRRSEWAALEIIRQTIKKRSSILFTSKTNFPLIPQNILIPAKWKEITNQKYVTWDDWIKTCGQETILLRESDPIFDDRYYPLWKISERNTDPWEEAYSCGLVLLGILRLSFIFPCSWNPNGQARLWSNNIGKILSRLPCSSWTLAILQSTILPRNRETFFLRFFGQNNFCKNDDTTFDPPEVNNLDSLNLLIKKSQSVLEKYRITVQEHKPRQLIPLSLDQIGKSLFEPTGGDI